LTHTFSTGGITATPEQLSDPSQRVTGVRPDYENDPTKDQCQRFNDIVSGPDQQRPDTFNDSESAEAGH